MCIVSLWKTNADENEVIEIKHEQLDSLIAWPTSRDAIPFIWNVAALWSAEGNLERETDSTESGLSIQSRCKLSVDITPITKKLYASGAKLCIQWWKRLRGTKLRRDWLHTIHGHFHVRPIPMPETQTHCCSRWAYYAFGNIFEIFSVNILAI